MLLNKSRSLWESFVSDFDKALDFMFVILKSAFESEQHQIQQTSAWLLTIRAQTPIAIIIVVNIVWDSVFLRS